MKSTLFSKLYLLITAFLLLQGVEAIQAQESIYCTDFGQRTGTNRYVTSIGLSDGTNSGTVNIGQSTTTQIYFDKTSQVIELTAGKQITPTVDAYMWAMHAYLYVDLDNDGLFNLGLNFDGTPEEGGELLSYAYFNGKNSKGENADAGEASNYQVPTFTIPANILPGNYRARYKLDYNKIDPCVVSDLSYVSVVADFTIKVLAAEETIPERTITLVANPIIGGTVTGGGTASGAIECVATPAEGYRFVNWTDEGEVLSTVATYVDRSEGDKTYTANFEEITYTISAFINGNGYTFINGSIKQSVTVKHGEYVTLSASFDSSNTFVEWLDLDSNEVLSNEVNYVIASVQRDYRLLAKVETYKYSASVEVVGDGTATVNDEEGTIKVEPNTRLVYKAVANEGSQFIKWTYSNNVINTSPEFITSAVIDNMTMVAHFELMDYDVNLMAYGFGRVSIDGEFVGAKSVKHGTSVTLGAHPEEGHHFVGWKNQDGVLVSDEIQYTIENVNGPISYSANFEEGSSIKNTSGDNVAATVVNEDIVVKGISKGTHITIYTSNGTLVANTVSSDSESTISVPIEGVLIVKVGNKVIRVIK